MVLYKYGTLCRFFSTLKIEFCFLSFPRMHYILTKKEMPVKVRLADLIFWERTPLSG